MSKKGTGPAGGNMQEIFTSMYTKTNSGDLRGHPEGMLVLYPNKYVKWTKSKSALSVRLAKKVQNILGSRTLPWLHNLSSFNTWPKENGSTYILKNRVNNFCRVDLSPLTC